MGLSPTYTCMRIERDGSVARLVLTEAERGNPIDGKFCADWSDAAIELSSDPETRAILLQADGKNFSVGGDISAFVRDLDDLPVLIKRWTAAFHAGVSRLQRANAPLVAAVQNVCAGGAVALVAAADYVLATEGAMFVSAYAGLAYSCDGGASIMLSRRMGEARAKRFLMLRETLNAQQALATGLVDEIVPADQLKLRAEEMAAKLAAGPTFAYGELKRIFVSVKDTALEAQLEFEAQSLARCAGTADAREAITAFQEKRKPTFTGK